MMGLEITLEVFCKKSSKNLSACLGDACVKLHINDIKEATSVIHLIKLFAQLMRARF